METNTHSKILTIINDEYRKMLSQEATINQTTAMKQQKSISLSTANMNNFTTKKQPGKLVKKFRGLVRNYRNSNQDIKSKNMIVSTQKVEVRTSEKTSVVPTALVNVMPREPLYDNQIPNSPLSQTYPKKRRKGCFGRSSKEIYRWEPQEGSLAIDFCRDTSLHGLKYIGQSNRHLSERIFWFIAFWAGLILSVVLISDVWNKYNSSPIIISFQPFQTTVDEIPFPAITVCNMNKVMKTKALEYIRMGEQENSYEDVFYLDHVCSATKSFTKKFNHSQGLEELEKARSLIANVELGELTKVNEFLRKASQNCSDMIPMCIWQDEIYNCSRLFRPIETEFGKCCTFNMVPQSVLYTLRDDERDDPNEVEQWRQWSSDTDGILLTDFKNEFPRRQMQAGKSFGLSFMLNPSLEEYFCTTSDSTGYRLTTHLPVDTPHVTDFGISIRPNAEVFVNVKSEITMVDPTIFKFDLNIRRCYRLGEYTLKYFKFYTPSNCVDECIANATMGRCGCKRYYMPRDANQTLCGGNLTSFECAESVKLNMTKYGAKRVCKMCYPSCSDIEFQSQTTTTPLQQGVLQSANTAGWINRNVSIVHIFLGEDSTYARVRKELFGFTDLFANTGGLMGLCLGFSGLSLLEILYFCTLRAWWASQRRHGIRQRASKKLQMAWAKIKAVRIFQGGNQTVLDNQVENQEIENALGNSKFYFSPAYTSSNYSGNIQQVNDVKSRFGREDEPGTGRKPMRVEIIRTDQDQDVENALDNSNNSKLHTSPAYMSTNYRSNIQYLSEIKSKFGQEEVEPVAEPVTEPKPEVVIQKDNIMDYKNILGDI